MCGCDLEEMKGREGEGKEGDGRKEKAIQGVF
jgi:hypothetical protein